MKVSRLLGTSAAAAVLTLVPTAAFAADYGGVGPNEGGRGNDGSGGSVGPNQGSLGAGRAGTGSAVAGAAGGASSGGLPSTGSTALDTAIGGAGLALVLGGGAMVVASRRRNAEPA